MKDLGEASFVLDIEFTDRYHGMLRYLKEPILLKRINVNGYWPSDTPIVKGNELSKSQFLKNDLEREVENQVFYTSAIGSLMYSQLCTWPGIAYAISVLRRSQSNPVMDHWWDDKKVMRFLQYTKHFMVVYNNNNNLEIVGYVDLILHVAGWHEICSRLCVQNSWWGFHGEVLNRPPLPPPPQT